jgi:hypothetical protein
MARPNNISAELESAIKVLGDALDQRKGSIQPGWESGPQRNIIILSITGESGQPLLTTEQEKALVKGLGKYSAKIEDGVLSIVKPAVYSKRKITKFIHRMNRELLDGTAAKSITAGSNEAFEQMLAETPSQSNVSDESRELSDRRWRESRQREQDAAVQQNDDVPVVVDTRQVTPADEKTERMLRETPSQSDVSEESRELSDRRWRESRQREQDAAAQQGDGNAASDNADKNKQDDDKPIQKDEGGRRTSLPIIDPIENATPQVDRPPPLNDEAGSTDHPEAVSNTGGGDPGDGKPPRKPSNDNKRIPLPMVPPEEEAPVESEPTHQSADDRIIDPPLPENWDDDLPPLPPDDPSRPIFEDEPSRPLDDTDAPDLDGGDGPPDNDKAGKDTGNAIGAIGDFLSKNVIATGITIAATVLAGGYGIYKYLTGQSDKKADKKTKSGPMKPNPEMHAGAVGVSERKVELKSRDKER